MAEDCHENKLKSQYTCTQIEEVNSVNSKIQDLLDSLHTHKEKLQESSLLTCTEFSSLCEQLDNTINAITVNDIPEDLRLSFSTVICDFISTILQEICNRSEMPCTSHNMVDIILPFNVLTGIWSKVYPSVVGNQLTAGLQDKIISDILNCLEKLLAKQFQAVQIEQILFLFYLFLESIESLPSVHLIIESLKPVFFNKEYEMFHFLTLFIVSLFICEENSSNIAEVFTITKSDIELLTSEATDAISFTLKQKLKFVSKMCTNKKNQELLTDETLVQMVCSVYTDENLTVEHELASTILTYLYSDASQNIIVVEEDSAASEDILSSLLNDLAIHVEESMQNCSDEERGLRICTSLQNLLTNMLSDEEIESISNYPCAVNVFCIYLKLHIEHLDQCSAAYCQEIVHFIEIILEKIFDNIPTSHITVIESGLAYALIDAIHVFTSEQEATEDLKSRLVLTISILSNCFVKISEYHLLNETTTRQLLLDLRPLMVSDNEEIYFNTQGCLLRLGPFLFGQDRHVLILSYLKIKELIDGLKKAICNSDYKVVLSCDICISALELLNLLKCATLMKQNIILMIENSIFEVLLSFTGTTKPEIMKSSLDLAWAIIVHEEIKKSDDVLKKALDFVMSIKSLVPIKYYHYLFSAFYADLKTDETELERYAKGCLSCKHYEECKQVCHHILKCKHLDESQRISAIMIFIEAEYFLYQQEEKWYLTYKDVLMKEKMLYLKESKLQRAKTIIEYIYKYNALLNVDKFPMYLDIALMECIRFNELQNIKCCVLCLKQGQKLQRSHIIPRSILQCFRKAVQQYSGNIAFEMDNPFTHSYGMLFTDKTLAKYMLCKSCEAILNDNGEQHFYQNFFQKIYDPVNEDCLSRAHEISYTHWLYHFSIGIIFRCIAAFTGIPSVVNDHEVYSLFTCCRKFLLNEELPTGCLPAIYIFINQTVPLLKPEQEWLYETLVGPALFSVSKLRLSDGMSSSYPLAHFILAKIGIINFVVDLSLAKDADLGLHQVNPRGRLFKVPIEHERYLLPGIEKVYSKVSKQQKRRLQDSMYRKHPHAPKELDGNSYLSFKKSYKLTLGIDSDLKNVEKEAKRINIMCLPSTFVVDPNRAIVEFPSPYSLLIHYFIDYSDEIPHYNAMLFIGIKKLKPFFVFYEEGPPEESLCFGCTFSQSDYSIEEYITDVPLSAFNSSVVGRIKELATKFIPFIIRNAVSNSGFSSLHSLFYHYHYNSFDHVFDTRCASYNEQCWYCKPFCDNCLHQATFGSSFSLPMHPEFKFKFCGLDCKSRWVNCESSFELCIHISDDAHDPSDCILDECKRLFRIQGHVAIVDSGCARFFVTICVNLKSEYLVLYKEVGLVYKKHAEYFVSKEGTFLGFLSHNSDTLSDILSDTLSDIEFEGLKFDHDIEFEDLKFGELISSYIELGIICYEMFKLKSFKRSSVVIPVGVDFRKDLFCEKSLSFPKHLAASPVQSFINSLYALRLVNYAKDQHILVANLANAASKQLEYLCNENVEPDMEICKLIEEVLIEVIPELINIPKKTTMSAFTMQLWNFIDKRVEILSNELVDVLLQYLSARTKAFKHDQQHDLQVKIEDVLIIQIFRQKKIVQNSQFLSILKVVQPILQTEGSFRWAILFILALYASYLPDHHLLTMKYQDISCLETYLTDFTDPSEVLTVFESLLMVPKNCELLIANGLAEKILDFSQSSDGTRQNTLISVLNMLLEKATPSTST